MDLREVGCDPRDWIYLAEDRDQWRRAAKNLRVLIMQPLLNEPEKTVSKS